MSSTDFSNRWPYSSITAPSPLLGYFNVPNFRDLTLGGPKKKSFDLWREGVGFFNSQITDSFVKSILNDII